MTNEETRTRRRFLATLGGVAATAALAGCPGGDRDGPGPETGTPTPESRGTGTETETDERSLPDREVVDVVEAGASPDGDEPVEDVLASVVGDDTELRFPPGEYLMTSPVRVPEFSNLAFVGEDATIRPEQGYDDLLLGLGNPGSATGLTVRGLHFDVSARETGVRPIDARIEDDLLISDVRVTGEQDVDQDSVRVDVTSDGGSGVVRRLALPDGGASQFANTGCYVGDSHVGSLRFVDCHVAGFPDNGLYASPAIGPVRVEGGRYENCDVSNVRVSGPATVTGVHVRCDTSPEGFENMRGIRLREGDDVLVENSLVELTEVAASDGAITMSNWLESATIRNTHVAVDAEGVTGILAKSPAEGVGGSDDYRVRVEDVTVAGTAAKGAAIRLLEREDCLVDGTCIYQPGEGRDGVECTRVSDSALRDSSISVTGAPVVLENAEISRSGLDITELSPGEDGNGGC